MNYHRHEVEKNEGGRRLWKQITGTNMYNWWVGNQDVNNSKKENIKKTR